MKSLLFRRLIMYYIKFTFSSFNNLLHENFTCSFLIIYYIKFTFSSFNNYTKNLLFHRLIIYYMKNVFFHRLLIYYMKIFSKNKTKFLTFHTALV